MCGAFVLGRSVSAIKPGHREISPRRNAEIDALVRSGAEPASVDDHVAAEQDVRRDCDAQRSGGFGIHDHLEFGGLLDR